MRDRTDWKNEIKLDVAAQDLSAYDIYDEEYWNISDIVGFLTMHQLILLQDHDSDLIQQYKNRQNSNFLLIKEGISRGKLKIIKSMEMARIQYKSPLLPFLGLRAHIRHYSWCIGKRIELLNPDNKLLTQFVLPDDVLRFVKEMNVDFPEKSSTSKETITSGAEPQSDANCSGEQPDHSEQMKDLASVKTQREEREPSVGRAADDTTHGHDIQKLKTDIARENAEKNGEKWRLFISSNIKPAVEHELALKCLCLHRDMAERLNERLSTEAKKCLKPKDYKNTDTNLTKKIEKAIKTVFYEFDENYKNVRSRVFRGDFYNEYDRVPCDLHSGK